jgi:GT2 family glycosyltransferase
MTDRAWRLFDRLGWSLRRRGVLGTARLAARKLLGSPPTSDPDIAAADFATRYPRWLARRQPGRIRLAALRYLGGGAKPLVTLVVPADGATSVEVGRCIESALAQVHRRWELRLVRTGAAAGADGTGVDAWVAKDPRVRVETHPGAPGSLAVDRALQAASGEFVALVEATATLAPLALREVAGAIARDPELDIVYSDEDISDGSGITRPSFKPDWSPDLALSRDYVGGLCVFRKELLARAGGVRPGFDAAEEYELLLRLSENARRIGHLPAILYHRASAATESTEDRDASARKAVESALVRRRIDAQVTQMAPGLRRVRYAIDGTPRVSIVIPTRDRVELLRTCISSIVDRSTYRQFELLVVDNGSSDPEAVGYLRSLPEPHRVLHHASAFNWSAINNAAARVAKGEYLLFLNNDVEVITTDWLEAMLEHAQRRPVGVVGAKLLYPDDTVQHAGVVIGIGGFADHAFRRSPAAAPGYLGLANVVRNTSAVTGACMMVRRRVFEELSGFDERLRVAFNDIDFCLRARERAYLVVHTPHALLYHHESATRGPLHPRAEYQYMRRRWRALIARGDPYYNPNLTLDREDFGLGE